MKQVDLLKPLLLAILATMFLSCEFEFEAQVEKREQEYLESGNDSVALLIFQMEQRIIEIPKSYISAFKQGDVFLFKHDSLYLGVETKYKIINNWEATKLNSNKNTTTFRTLTLENIERRWKEIKIGLICFCILLVMLVSFVEIGEIYSNFKKRKRKEKVEILAVKGDSDTI